MNQPMNHLGGAMYGDGDYVIEFENVGSAFAPMVATVLSPKGLGYTVGPFADHQRPTVLLAAQIIARVRADEEA